jgi:two-component sensor histidine kinase/tetratricopeptide (TPR) repeat protein
MNFYKKLLFAVVISLSLSGKAQTFGDKSFYLLDSLDLELVDPNNRAILDSCLGGFFKEKEDTAALFWIIQLADNINDDYLSEQYMLVANDYIHQRIYKPTLSKDEIRFFYLQKANVYSSLGYHADGRGEIEAALNYYQESLKILEVLDDKAELCVLYLNFSGLYFDMKNYDVALDYSYKAVDELKQMEGGNTEYMIFALNNIAVVYGDKGDTEKAIEYHLKSLAICDSTGNRFGAGMINNNIGGIYGQTDRSELAFKHFKLAEEIFLDLNDNLWVSFTYHKMGSTYLQDKQYELAEKYAKLCQEYAELSQRVQPKMRAANLLYRLNEKIGNYKDAFYYYQKHEHFADSISGEKIRMATLQMEMNFQLENEKAIAAKENEKKLEVSFEREKRQELISYAILTGLILVFTFMIILFYRLRITTKQKKIIEKQNDERKLLLQEIHHRVKNNFQIVSSVLKLQAAEEDNSVIDRAFDDAINRIHSMAAVHEMIYKQDDFSAIAPKNYFSKLTDSMRTYSLERAITFEVDSKIEALSVQTLIPLGISVNEMITNSIKYAFTDSMANPKIRVQLFKSSTGYTLSYQDNGIGFKSQLKADSFGMGLIETILEQIDGKLEKVDDPDWNTHLKIYF